MARTLSEIFGEAKAKRNEYLELTEFKNDSKMSILDAITWVVSACIWSFENIMDVFETDIVSDLSKRVNGTPEYYSMALLKYQTGDELVMNDEGTAFSYTSIDDSKRIISKVSYELVQQQGYYDKKTVFKVATGPAGSYKRISADELVKVRDFLQKIAFAGTALDVVSRRGSILIPRVTVYYNGAVTEDEVYSNIEKSLNDFIQNADFNGTIYVQKIIDAIQSAEHVVDVFINPSSNTQGVFVVEYDDDDSLIATAYDSNNVVTSYERQVTRSFIPNGGYIKQSTGTEDESSFQTWRAAMTFLIEA